MLADGNEPPRCEVMLAASIDLPMFKKPQETRAPYFDFRRAGNHFRCDLITRGEETWFVELFKNDVFDHHVGGPFDTPDAAKQEADKERDAIERGELDDW